MTSEELVNVCRELAENKKALDVVVLDLRNISSFTDYFVICSGHADPHLKAIAGEIEKGLKDRGVRPAAVDGDPRSNWIVLDYQQVVVHIFKSELREHYALERLWADAPRV